MTENAMPLATRLELLLNHLGVQAAHFGARTPQDAMGLLQAAPQRVATLTLVGANARPEALGALGSRTLWITGDGGAIGSLMTPRLESLAAGQALILSGYDEFQWSDTVADRIDEVASALERFLETNRAPSIRSIELSGEGEVAGISYVAAGSGPPVVLLPLGLSAHQWDALLPKLQQRHCAIVLGGPYLAPVSMLESRAASDYARVALGTLDMAEPKATDSLIEIGCGSGALLRRILQMYSMPRVVGLDVNAFLLKEAATLASKAGVADRIELREGSAEETPFPPATFDVVFSSTVMEEVDAVRMMAELVRIAKPGGRVAVVVRAADGGTKTNAALTDGLRQRIESSDGTGGVDEHGCADASLCQRMQEAGLRRIRGGPASANVQPGDPWWTAIDAQIRGRLSAEDAEAWGKVVETSYTSRFPLWVARPFHYAVGVKP